MRYWLLKSEPETYSWTDLKSQPNQTDIWDGVRNYQARNFLRDMRINDLAFFYHSVVRPQAIVGIVRIVREAYPDPTQFDPQSPYYDPKSDPDQPRWVAVDVQAVQDVLPPITRDELKSIPELEDMPLLRKGNRLSVQPVTPQQWQRILALRNIPELS
ncbi:MAG: EVE domain-containing protein [Calditrichaeota bacterium]|nr:EVE domain-containing protein [Calditrichota bacterium]